jgi:Recombination endonuclease VII
MKRCGHCKLRKNYIDFFKNISTPDGYGYNCKRCHTLYTKIARIGEYGLTKEQFDSLLENQDNRCAICQSIFDVENIPVIDHDHSCCPRIDRVGRIVNRCGKCVRGLLCRSCNAGLGMFKDEPQRLISAYKYLTSQISLGYLLDIVSLEEVELIDDIMSR